MKNKLKSSQLKLAVILIIIVSGIVALALNRGLRYTTYNPSYVVTVAGDGGIEVVEYLARNYSPARVDRDNLRVLFQELTKDNFTEILAATRQEFTEQADEIVISATYEDPTVLFLSGSSSIVFGGSMLLGGYLIYKYLWDKLNTDDRLKISILFSLSIFSGVVGALGFVSVLSSVVSVSERTIYMVALSSLLAGLVLYHATSEYIEEQMTRKDSAIDRVTAQINIAMKDSLPWIGVGTLTLIVVLGSNFLLDGLVLLFAYVFVLSSTVRLPRFYYALLGRDWSHLGGERNRTNQSEERNGAEYETKENSKQTRQTKTTKKPKNKKRRQ